MTDDRISGRDPFTGEALAVSVENGIVSAIEVTNDEQDTIWLSAGLIDLQVNGYAGLDLNDGQLQPATVAKLSRVLLARGVTRYLPTIITASEDAILRALEAIARAIIEDPVAAAMIAGVHVEGPSISPDDGPRGAHPRAHVRQPDLAEFKAWQAVGNGLVRMVTLSPHWPDCEDYIAALAKAGVVVALGHTDASPDQIAAAVSAGARMSTHLGNGAASMLPRHPNIIWSQLAQDRLNASFIADGHHLPAEALRSMIRAKGLERAILVSDSAALGGMTPGRYDQHIGGQVDVSADGKLSVAGTPYLAGAGRMLNENIALAATMADLSLADALKMATINPAGMIGEGGVIAVGSRADIVAFRYRAGDLALDVTDVWLAGERRTP